jgi:hypothetical protein
MRGPKVRVYSIAAHLEFKSATCIELDGKCHVSFCLNSHIDGIILNDLCKAFEANLSALLSHWSNGVKNMKEKNQCQDM